MKLLKLITQSIYHRMGLWSVDELERGLTLMDCIVELFQMYYECTLNSNLMAVHSTKHSIFLLVKNSDTCRHLLGKREIKDHTFFVEEIGYMMISLNACREGFDNEKTIKRFIAMFEERLKKDPHRLLPLFTVTEAVIDLTKDYVTRCIDKIVEDEYVISQDSLESLSDLKDILHEAISAIDFHQKVFSKDAESPSDIRVISTHFSECNFGAAAEIFDINSFIN